MKYRPPLWTPRLPRRGHRRWPLPPPIAGHWITPRRGSEDARGRFVRSAVTPFLAALAHGRRPAEMPPAGIVWAPHAVAVRRRRYRRRGATPKQRREKQERSSRDSLHPPLVVLTKAESLSLDSTAPRRRRRHCSVLSSTAAQSDVSFT